LRLCQLLHAHSMLRGPKVIQGLTARGAALNA